MITVQGQVLWLFSSTVLSRVGCCISVGRPQKRLENRGFDILATSAGSEENLRLPTLS